jgi:glucosamine--fructose-6-phosphate aminotransferase (isomerizing)
VPLFMAGDKHYFYWSNKIASQTKVKSIILCENPLETTKFKSGFCNIKPRFGTKTTYALSLRNKFEMLFYYSKNFAKNFSYLNTSLLDTFTSFLSYYVMKHNFINLFDYIEWNEEEINNLLIKEYNWETSKDSHSTWRIGDGTASFYNYIYYTMAGITENDTFRSNQVRERDITREQALKLSVRDNMPQFESIKWYLNTIGLDFRKTLQVINDAKKLY